MMGPQDGGTLEGAFADEFVGHTALVCMYASVLFVILQGVVWVPVAVFMFLLPGLGVLAAGTAEVLGMATWACLEVSLVVYLVYFVRMRLPRRGETPDTDFEGEIRVEGKKPVLFTERRLEVAMMATAVGTMLYGKVMGLDVFAIRIAVIVVEGFAALFVFIFCLVRLAVTKRIRAGGLASLLLTGMSLLWALME